MEHLQQLASGIGPRVSGTGGEDDAIAYIREQFEASGYSVEVAEFVFSSGPFRSSSVEADGQTYDTFAMSGSGTGRVEGPGIFVGLADEAGIGGRDLTGKVAVADRGTLQFIEKLQNVAEAGAIALVVVNNREGEFVGNLQGDRDIPAVTVNDVEGAFIRGVAEEGGTIAVEVPPGASTDSANVIAKPSPGSECRIIVGGHHDTVPGAPGAHDNASGTAAVLELARAFAVDGLEEGLCFVTFGGEESGLNGSRALVDVLAAADELPEIMVNIDANGVGTRVDLIGTDELTQRARDLATSLGIESAITELGENFGSDHMSFQDEGVPVLFFTSDSIGSLHTPQDTVDTINPQLVEDGGDLAYAVLQELLEEGTAG
jgi:aminopeptidase YwaD